MAMAEARQRDEWDRWALLLAEAANHNFSRKKPASASDFNPFTQKDIREAEDRDGSMFSIEDYKKAFLKIYPPKPEPEAKSK